MSPPDEPRTAWTMRTTGKTYDGTACDNCGTTYEACSRKVFRPDGRACCGACGYMDTHDEREVEQGERLEAHKFRVERMADPTGKHAGCWYFVLDPKHDPHAVAALATYADAVRAEHPGLAADLDAKVAEHRRTSPDRHGQPVERFGADGGRLLPASDPGDDRG